MPLGPFEREVLRLLAANRNPDSFVAGATVLNQHPTSARTSRDIDLFHDTTEAVATSARRDIETLQSHAFRVDELPPHETFRRAIISRNSTQTKIEWVFDSAFRFFPVEADPELGWRLNFFDAAANKVLALAGRSEVRDLIDVLELHDHHLHLGALAWAGSGKDPGMTPESIIEWGGRNAIYRSEDLADLALSKPTTLPALKERWMQASREALDLIKRLPLAEVGCLYLDSHGKPVRPDPGADNFASLVRHHGSVRGAWPRIAQK
jgi:hypothetical protein